jgi:Tol biopolymer transport system component
MKPLAVGGKLGPYEILAPVGRIGDPTLSPDGSKVACERQIADNLDIWVDDLKRGVMT